MFVLPFFPTALPPENGDSFHHRTVSDAQHQSFVLGSHPSRSRLQYVGLDPLIQSSS